MRILVAAVGRLKAGPERDLVARYVERFTATGRSLALSPLDLVEIDESRARRPEDRKTEEAAALLRAAGGGLLIALDERGKAEASETFASRVAGWRDAGTPSLAFIIGGADGLDDSVREAAALTLSFGKLTIPHQLVRVLVMEQLYRVATILSGHPYHRA